MKQEFDYIKIKLASPGRILDWSTRRLPNDQLIGKVQKSETVNYRTFKPEMDGLFCERIFGPVKSLECACGKYKHIRYDGLVCERCGVELTESRVRRHRMGYIHLSYPVAHIWYISNRPNYMALLLEVEDFEKNFNTSFNLCSDLCEDCLFLKPITATLINLWDERIKRIKLASLIYFIADDECSFYGLHWDLQQYRQARAKQKTNYPLKPVPKPDKTRPDTPDYLLNAIPSFLIGTRLIQFELAKLNLNREISQSRFFIYECSQILNQKTWSYLQSHWFRKWEISRIMKLKQSSIKRLRILENLVGTGSNANWMILSYLPVIPPGLRPMIQLEGGRFATSDLNELYRRIITRNNRLLRLLEIDAPELIIRNEKRMLQEAIDTLIDNGKRGKVVLNANNRALKSLSDIIKGKHGRFRQNLLGKRVDYSGRSVIIVGPSLKLNQCGLPYEMAVELFQPFIIRELLIQGLASNMKIARTLIIQNDSSINLIIEKILINHPIFLNRAPTLHRLGVQAFEPILVEGRAIKLHPLVCSAFNADFDGDQMAVHVPLSLEAQAECYVLMLAMHNFLSPANGDPIITPSQDMILGCYYLTMANISNLPGSSHYFADFKDVLLAYEQGKIEIHSSIWVRCEEEYVESDKQWTSIYTLEDGSTIEYYKNLQIRKTQAGEVIVKYLRTTTGRVILNSTIQKTLNYKLR